MNCDSQKKQKDITLEAERRQNGQCIECGNSILKWIGPLGEGLMWYN